MHSPVHSPSLFEQVTVLDQYHFGGYAKTTPELAAFVEQFNRTRQFPIEATYTGKALHALARESAAFEKRFQSVLFIHTGGLHINL